MAFTNTPDNTTYRTQRFQLLAAPSGRSGTSTSDSRFVNLFPEPIKDQTKTVFMKERPGTIYKYSLPAGTARGMANFNGSVYTAVGNQLYRDTTAVATLAGTSGRVGFTLFNGTYTALIVVDGTNGWVIKTDNTITQITNVNFPTPHLPYPIFLDGYLFLAKSGTDDIYNSNLEDPLTWTAGNFITAEMYPDPVVCLAKQKNYLVAIGDKTTEQFYDAGNASGSPLQRNDSAVQQIGCPAPESVVSADKEVVLVGTTNSGGRTVWSISGFESKEIGISIVNQHLTTLGSNIASVVGAVVNSVGHKFYILTTPSRTWVYDFGAEWWHEWSFTDDVTPFLYKYSCDHSDGDPRFMHPTNGSVVSMDETVAHDAVDSVTNVPIYAVAQTSKIDFSSNNRKACHRLSLIADVPNHAGSVPVAVQWSDDDYTTWTAARNINLQSSFSFLNQLGMFRRRAFKFVYNQDYPIRMEGFELDVNIGGN